MLGDKRSDLGCQPFTRVFLQEVTGSRGHGVVDARSAGDCPQQDRCHAAGNRVTVAERHEEGPVPGGQRLPGGPVRFRRGVVRGGGYQSGHGPRPGHERRVAERRIVGGEYLG